jgi:hypothetical protein
MARELVEYGDNGGFVRFDLRLFRLLDRAFYGRSLLKAGNVNIEMDACRFRVTSFFNVGTMISKRQLTSSDTPTPPSAGVIARDLSEKIEKAIIQHCESFTQGERPLRPVPFRSGLGGQDLQGLRANDQQSKVINGESYIVVNYKANSLVKSIWMLWNAEDRFFSPRLANSNARSLRREAAAANIEVIFP